MAQTAFAAQVASFNATLQAIEARVASGAWRRSSNRGPWTPGTRSFDLWERQPRHLPGGSRPWT